MSLYRAMNEDEVMAARYNLLDDGDYNGVVKISTARSSSNGNHMADMWVEVFDKNGEPHDIRDFLVFSKNMLWKIKHFCDSAGLEKEYLADQFTPDMAKHQHIRARVRKRAGTEIPPDKLNGKPMGSRYPDQNIIEDYIKDEFAMENKENFINDDISF